MHFLYNLLTYLLFIPLAIYWLVRAAGNRTYLDRLLQRFGFGFPDLEACIWIHAVSVGEVQAAVPLIKALRVRYPQQQLLVTTVTPTGAARVYAQFGDSVLHCFIPFEFPHAIRNFFSSIKPRLAMIVETEIWPNLYRGCGTRDIPLVLVSARISPRSVSGYRRLLPLIRETLSHGIVIAAQSQADADRFIELGASPLRTTVTGNIKFDVKQDPEVPKDGKRLRSETFGERPVWVAASTHDGEEGQILDAHRTLLKEFPTLLLVLIPRHPERFDNVRNRIEQAGFPLVSRTQGIACGRDTQVFLGDTMGEVPLFYAASDIAFVGGSLAPVGGHNLLEPAAYGLPIITGPHLFNAQEVAKILIDSGACCVVENASELSSSVARLLHNSEEARQMGDRGIAVLEQNRGSLKRLLILLEPLLEPQGR